MDDSIERLIETVDKLVEMPLVPNLECVGDDTGTRRSPVPAGGVDPPAVFQVGIDQPEPDATAGSDDENPWQ